MCFLKQKRHASLSPLDSSIASTGVSSSADEAMIIDSDNENDIPAAQPLDNRVLKGSFSLTTPLIGGTHYMLSVSFAIAPSFKNESNRKLNQYGKISTLKHLHTQICLGGL